jgi:hypothetical protein
VDTLFGLLVVCRALRSPVITPSNGIMSRSLYIGQVSCDIHGTMSRHCTRWEAERRVSRQLTPPVGAPMHFRRSSIQKRVSNSDVTAAAENPAHHRPRGETPCNMSNVLRHALTRLL